MLDENDKSDILFLFFNNVNNDNVFLDYFNATEGINGTCVFKSVNKFLRAVRKLHLLSGFPGIGIWFLDWKKQIKNRKRIVCIASAYSPRILKWIKKKEPDSKLINYYWDRIDISHYPIVNTLDYENWTFCKGDAEQYNFLYNPQFYIKSMTLEQQDIIYDASFVGADREGTWTDRIPIVNDCYYRMINNNIKPFFWFVSDSNLVDTKIRKDKRINEREYNLIVAKSKAIIELVQPEKEWITLRPLLALSNGKKVITNNKYIMEETFYSKNNIFILDIDKDEDLSDFISSDFEEIEQDILDYYDVKAWSKRFFES